MLNKMLRATLSKLKKVCFDTLNPRNFRGDYYNPGNFQKLSATTLSRAHKSTKSGKGSKDDEEECKKIIAEIFNNTPEGQKVSEDPSIDLSNIQEIKNEHVTPIVSRTECEKLIAQAFGKDSDNTRLPNDALLSATTAKQTEEQLAQKVETIDEIPLVETEKPKIEGFNVTPKVLGAEENVGLETLKFHNSGGKDEISAGVIDEKTNKELEELCEKIARGNRFYHAGKNLYNMPEFDTFENRNPIDPSTSKVSHPYDDIAKRCINIPPNKVDLYILRELERLGVPNSSAYGTNSCDTSNTDDQHVNNFSVQRGDFGDTAPGGQLTNPLYENEQLKVEKHVLDKRPMPLCMMQQYVIDDTVMTLASEGTKPAFNPNRMLVDPFDKKSLCYDCVDPEYEAISYDKLHVLVQRLENMNDAKEEQTDNLQRNETTQTEQTQSADKIQSHVKPEYQGYVIKPIHESPRLPQRPINYCNENLTIHPANREQHYSMEQFQDGERLHHEMNLQENMVPTQLTDLQVKNLDRPTNYQDPWQFHYYWNKGYDDQSKHYQNRFKNSDQNDTLTQEESPPKEKFSYEQKPSLSTAAVHVYTNTVLEKSETPKTVETVLPRNQIMTDEGVGEQKQPTLKLISNENIAPDSGEESKIYQQLHFKESPAQHQQYWQPSIQDPPTEQVDRPNDPIHISENNHLDINDLRRLPIEQTKDLGTGKVNQEKIDINEENPSVSQPKILGSVKADPEQLDIKDENLTDQAQILGSTDARQEKIEVKEENNQIETLKILRSVKADPEQLDIKEEKQPIEELKIQGSVKADPEQLEIKEEKPPIEELKILGSVKTDPEQLHIKEEKPPTEELKILRSVKNDPEQLEIKEEKTQVEQLKMLGSVQADPEQLDIKEEKPPIKELKTLGSMKADPEQLNIKEEKQPIEELKILGSVKADPDQLDIKEEKPPIEELKADPEQLEIKEEKQSIDQLKILGSVKIDPKQLDIKEENPQIEELKTLGSVKADPEQLDIKEEKQPIEELKILGSMKADPEQLDIKEEKPQIEELKILGSVKADPEQLEMKEEKQSIDQLKILGSVKANPKQLDIKEEKPPIEEVKILGSVKADPEQLEIKEEKQSIDQLKILGSVKADPEELDIKEEKQPIEELKILGSVEANPEQLNVKEEKPQIEELKILGSVKADPEQLGIKEEKQSIDQLKILGSVKADPEQLEFKEEKPPIEELKILGSVKADPEQLDIKEEKQSIDQLKILGSVKADPEQLGIKEEKQSIDQLKILGSVKADPEQLEFKEEKPPIEELKILGSVKADPEQLDIKEEKQSIDQLKILGSVKADPEQLDIKKEKPQIEDLKILNIKEEKQSIDQLKILGSVKAQLESGHNQEQAVETKVLGPLDAQEDRQNLKELPISNNKAQKRLELKKQAIEQLKILGTAKADPIAKIERSVERAVLQSSTSVNFEDQTNSNKQKSELGSAKRETPEKKTENIQIPTKSEDPNDEFKKKLASNILPLPKLNTDENLPLSVLLKRLRERSRIESFHDMIVPVGKKCGCPPPPCPPPAPTCPPPPPCKPPACPPPPPPCPKPCKPSCPPPCGPPKQCGSPKPPRCSKYIQVDTEFDFAAILRETDIFLKKHMYETVTAILTKDVVRQLEKMGVSLLITHPNEEIDPQRFDEMAELNSNSVDLAKDYEPWVPIPSWPIPRKVKKKPLVCPKDGCKILPPPKLNPPCKENPCIGFPKRSNSFSTPDNCELPDDVFIRFES